MNGRNSMGEIGDYWNEHRDHKFNVKHGIVICNSCGKSADKAKVEGFHYCFKCRKPFRTPKWKLEQESKVEEFNDFEWEYL